MNVASPHSAARSSAKRVSLESATAPQPGLSSLSPLPAMEAWADIGSELIDFFAERVREDVRLQHEVLHCRTPAHFMHIQLRYLQKAFDDYNAETGRLAEMSKRLMPMPIA